MIAHIKSSVALQTVVFIPESAPLPKKIKLSDCGLPLTSPMPGNYLTGFYGYQFKKEGLAAACAYASAKNLRPLFIDYVATFDLPLVKIQVSLELLDKTEFVSTQRISRELCDELAAYWREWIKNDHPRARLNDFNWDAPQAFIGRYPEYVPKLLARPEWKHIRLLAHPAYVKFSERPLILGTLNLKKATITEVQVRLRPEIEVTL